MSKTERGCKCPCHQWDELRYECCDAGFTWEDVDALRWLAIAKDAGAVGDGVTDDTPAFQRAANAADLASRIAALLPPRPAPNHPK